MQSISASLAAVAIITISCLRDTSCIWCNQKGTTTNISGDEKCGSIMFRPASTQPVKRQRCSLIELLSYLPNKITGRKDNGHRSSEKVQPDVTTTHTYRLETRKKRNPGPGQTQPQKHKRPKSEWVFQNMLAFFRLANSYMHFSSSKRISFEKHKFSERSVEIACNECRPFIFLISISTKKSL